MSDLEFALEDTTEVHFINGECVQVDTAFI